MPIYCHIPWHWQEFLHPSMKTGVVKSARGPAHSKTLARKSSRPGCPKGLGLRRPSAAFQPSYNLNYRSISFCRADSTLRDGV